MWLVILLCSCTFTVNVKGMCQLLLLKDVRMVVKTMISSTTLIILTCAIFLETNQSTFLSGVILDIYTTPPISHTHI